MSEDLRRVDPVESIYKDKPENFIKDYSKRDNQNLDTYSEYQKRANEEELKNAKKDEEKRKLRDENAPSMKEEYERALLRSKRPRIKQNEERDDR